MMSTRLITDIIKSCQAGSYTLPATVLEAHQVSERVQALTLPHARTLHFEDAGRALVDAVASGEDPDLTGMLDAIQASRLAAETHFTASAALTAAHEAAGNRLLSAVRASAEDIISNHLRAVFDDVLAQTRAAVNDLGTHPPVAALLLDAPAKVRTAYNTLGQLRHRLSIIRRSRDNVNTVTESRPALDVSGLYADFQNPTHWTRGVAARISAFPSPSDPVEYLVWLVGEAQPAQPWLPTVVEQDAAYQAGPFGEAQRNQAGASTVVRDVFASP